jgi:tetratricopeptide (TPR) repeat protein
MRLVVVFMAVLAAVAAPVWGADTDLLTRARTFYNSGKFEQAITAADEARKVPTRADAADLIAARAYLERYRESAADDDLANARTRLRRIDAQRLGSRERMELLVGFGETLFFDESFGAAAEVFQSVLASTGAVSGAARERVLDWWANARDRDARPRPDLERQTLYQRIRDRMAAELADYPASATAAYWLAAAARAQGDLQTAWDAAQAAWVRAPLAADRGVALRADVDALVMRGIVPERAKALAQPADALREEWDRFKKNWD